FFADWGIFSARMEIDPPRTIIGVARCGLRDLHVPRTLQFTQVVNQGGAKCDETLHILVVLQATAKPVVWVILAPIMKPKAQGGKTAFVTQKLWPFAFISRLRANDENAPGLVYTAVFDLLAKPIDLIAAPMRSQIMLRHNDKQNCRKFDPIFYFSSQM